MENSDKNDLNAHRENISNLYLKDEDSLVNDLLDLATLSCEQVSRIQRKARSMVVNVRKSRLRSGGIDAFLFEYDLSSDEGIALMCMAEALLRVPDSMTRDLLIKDKITSSDWGQHLGSSSSSFVNAATWGLMLTGKVIENDKTNTGYLKSITNKLIKRSGEPVIRSAVAQAMKILGRQFVMGTDIESAIKRAKSQEEKGFRYSYDMLGEAACNEKDSKYYFDSYLNSIIAIGKDSSGDGPTMGPGVSVKLSALHPRYEYRCKERVMSELYPRLLELALEAKRYNIGFTIDAEEADRLEIFMDIFEKLISDESIRGWSGIGLAVQAYQKRAVPLIKWLGALTRKYDQHIMLRLVKGAYWDSEIKASQINGLDDYPVFTRKVNTDVSYIACVKEILKNKDYIYPQFATHNAYTVSMVMELCKDIDYEFQCLHGMGDALYEDIVSKDGSSIPCRIYAPVGGYDNLLAYLVRRLLENGANTSFVNRIVDERAPVDEIIKDPCMEARKYSTYRHNKLPKPENLYGESRLNSRGYDINNPAEINYILGKVNHYSMSKTWSFVPMLQNLPCGEIRPCTSPSNTKRQIGTVTSYSIEQIYRAIDSSNIAFEKWQSTDVSFRSNIIVKLANLLEENSHEIYALLMNEAGKTIDDAVNELREAVDFCRYYADLANKTIKSTILPGPTGESNTLTTSGIGVILCISPWNFPLAIFLGQVTAALVAGNTVLAKPASQTPLIASFAVDLMYKAGIPQDVIQLIVASGRDVNDSVIPDERIKGVMFTGSNATAKQIQRGISARSGAIIPLIAETGGMNAMIVDSTALIEQVIYDVVNSAFGSAGQRCSALRVAYIQEDIYEKFAETLKGAMLELKVGDSEKLSTDIGPVIDQGSLSILEEHEKYLQENFSCIAKANPSDNDSGFFFTPCAYKINKISDIEEEVFGPILHVITYNNKNLDAVIDEINSVGYGLTFGMHSRIDEQVNYVASKIKVGNVYINRNMIGAVVGTQPFGGQGLSGTGPKAGGPHYLSRLMTEKTVCINTAAAGGNASLLSLGD